MKRVENIPVFPLPDDFGHVIAESSFADLRMLHSGTAFIGPHSISNADSVLVVASTPSFLRSVLASLEGRAADCWLMIVETNATGLADMLEDNPEWTLAARAEEPGVVAFNIRPSTNGDQPPDDVVAGLRLAATINSQSSRISVPDHAATPPESRNTLKDLLKRSIPRRAKTLLKKALARR